MIIIGGALDPRWRNLVALLLIILAGIGAYYFVLGPGGPSAFSSTPFGKDYAAIKVEFAKNSFAELPSENAVPYHNAPSLQQLKVGLGAIEPKLATNAGRAMLSFVADEVDYFSLLNATDSLNDAIDTKAGFCSNMPKYRAIAGNFSKLADMQAGLSRKAASFAKGFPSEAADINFSSGGVSDDVSARAGAINSSIELLGADCK